MFLFFHHNMVVGWNYNYPFWESTLFSFFLKWEIFHSPMVASTSGRLTMVWFNSRPLMVSVPVKSFSPFSLLSLSLSFLHASYEQQFLSFIILPCSVSKKVMRTHNKGTLWEYHWNFIKIAPCQASERNCCCYIILYGCIECATPHYTTLYTVDTHTPTIKVDLSQNEWEKIAALTSLSSLFIMHPPLNLFFLLPAAMRFVFFSAHFSLQC